METGPRTSRHWSLHRYQERRQRGSHLNYQLPPLPTLESLPNFESRRVFSWLGPPNVESHRVFSWLEPLEYIDVDYLSQLRLFGDDDRESQRLSIIRRYTAPRPFEIPELVHENTVTDHGQAFEVYWKNVDKENPKNWPVWYRGMILGFISFATMTVIMYSSAYASGIPGVMSSFNILDRTIPVLGITSYLMGLALGPLILAPLSEMYGRRPIYIITMALFAILVIPCATAPNLEVLLAMRFLGAFAGSVMVSNAPGTVKDIASDNYAALAFSIWCIGTINGPVIGPIIGGFVYETLGWRWINWVVLIFACVSFVMVASIKETYAPAILRKRAAKQREKTGDSRWWSRYDEQMGFWPRLQSSLGRPFIITFTEPICLFWDIYIAVIYAVLYLCFVAYPVVFTELRGWSPGITGLAYSGIGIGVLLAIASEPLLRRLIKAHKPDPVTGRPPPEAIVSAICIAGFLVPLGQFVFAWTSTPNAHWIFPILAGIPFGAGNCAVFIYTSSYLASLYGIYAASALAGNTVLRNIVGGVLPLAGPLLYNQLGANWAGATLAVLELVLAPIPVVFYFFGGRIRKKSALIRSMNEDLKRLEKNRKATAV